jgi:hypothetical protein
MVLQLVQAFGALLILVAFVLVQRKRMSTESLAWAGVSAFGLWRNYRMAQ